MTLDDFLLHLSDTPDDGALTAFCQSKLLHGTPYCFSNDEGNWFEFKSAIAQKFNVNHTNIFIVGSGKLGFSPVKRTEFSEESDIDVAIVSSELFSDAANLTGEFEYFLRDSRLHLPNYEYQRYVSFVRYLTIGWVRPDLAPHGREIGEWKNNWFDFFKEISYENCQAGNHKVSAGAFQSIEHLEKYSMNSLRRIKSTLNAEHPA